MTRTEYNKLKAGIIQVHGQPEWELNKPVNPSAVALQDLKTKYLAELYQTNKTKKLVKDVNALAIPDNAPVIVPDELLKESWLTPFNDKQKDIIRTWIQDISQSSREIAEATGQEIRAVRATLSCEAFKMLRGHLALAYKGLLPLEASAALRALLRSKTDNVVLQAAKLVLLDAGLYKGDSLEVTAIQSKDVKLDPATEERLRKLGNEVLGTEE